MKNKADKCKKLTDHIPLLYFIAKSTLYVLLTFPKVEKTKCFLFFFLSFSLTRNSKTI